MSRLILYYDGELQVTEDFTPSYVGGRNRPLHVDGILNLAALKLRIIRALRRDSNSHTVNLVCRIRNNGGYTAVQMDDDEVCEYVLIEAVSRTVVIYVEFVELSIDFAMPINEPDIVAPISQYVHFVPSPPQHESQQRHRMSLSDQPLHPPIQAEHRFSVSEQPSSSRVYRRTNLSLEHGSTVAGENMVTDVDTQYRSMDSGSSDDSRGPEPIEEETYACPDLNVSLLGHDLIQEHAENNAHNLDQMTSNNNYIQPAFTPKEWDAVDNVDEPIHINDRVHDEDIPDNIYEGMIFVSKASLQFSLSGWSIMHNVEYIQTCSNKTRLTVICAQHDNPTRPCLWRLHAAQSKRLGGVWKISSCRPPHTCTHPVLSRDHRNCNSKFISHFITGVIRKQLDMKPREIISRLESKFEIKLEYMKAWDARRKAIASVFGSYAESYSSLYRMMEAVKIAIPGSIYNIQRSTETRFKALFWSFGPSIYGWQFCRPVLSLDGTFLLGKYRGTLLAAVGIDANGGLFPFAFAIVESESNESWHWFLQNLQHLIPSIPSRSDLCFISDRHVGIIRGCREIFPHAAHRHCLRHLRENFKKEIRKLAIVDCDTVCDKMYWAGNSDDVEIFQRNMNDIRNVKPEAFEWLVAREFCKWTLIHDGGARYGIMTTNSSECFNGVLRRARGLPIQGLIASIYYNLVSLFQKRSNNASSLIVAGDSSFAPRTFAILDRNVKAARKCQQPISIHNTEFQVFDLASRSHKVEITPSKQMTCTCNKPQLYHMPCVHGIVVAGYKRWDYQEFVSPYYSLEFYKNTYSGLFHVIPDKQYWPPFNNDAGIIPLLPPAFRRRSGRPRTSRIRNTMDEHRSSSSRLCSYCKSTGHNSATCPYNPSSSRYARSRR